MRKIITLCISVLIIPAAVCCAQSSKKESFTISTYYPAPTGVYSKVRLFPSNSFIPGAACDNEGEAFYREDLHEAYICKGASPKWTKFGSEMKIYSSTISPATCNGVYCDTLTICNTTFYQDITFGESFSSPPNVTVSARFIPDPDHRHPCANGTDKIIAYPDSISATGFRVYASGSPTRWDSACTAGEKSNMTRAQVKWMAIGQ
jgi:hypothetical protein